MARSSRLSMLLALASLLLLSSCEVMGDYPRYTLEEVAYFEEIAIGGEYYGMNVITKWTQDIRVSVQGMPAAEHLRTLRQVMSEINHLVEGAVELRLDEREPAAVIHFLPRAEFRARVPSFASDGLGFVQAWSAFQTDQIRSAEVFIVTDTPDEVVSHIIREEVTQMMGLFRDSWRYPNSIFYQGHSTTTHYTRIDEALIRMLYEPEVRPGMSGEEAGTVLKFLHT